MKPWFFYARRTIRANQKQAGPVSFFTVLGIVLGVAALTVAMAVMSGFERTLKDAIIDVTGHMIVIKRGRGIENRKDFEEKIRSHINGVQGSVAFAMIEAVAAHGGKIQGVMFQGLDQQSAKDFLGIERRLVEGAFDLSREEDGFGVLIGTGIAKNFQLKVGDSFRAVLPITDEANPQRFERQRATFKVRGIVELGKHQFNERYIIADLSAVQEFAKLDKKYHGLIVKLDNADAARSAALTLTSEMGSGYWIRDWQDDNLFSAVGLEKMVVFVVLLLIIIVAAFNTSSTLFVSVVQKFSDISILKTVGASPRFILKAFAAQGLLMGLVGVVGGFLLGGVLSILFVLAQVYFNLIDGSVYKIDRIFIEFRFWDMAAIFFATVLICLFATLAPAWRGSRLKPVEGLRYE